MKELTPQEIVRELDRYIVGQDEAKRAVAIALRNRYRRLALPPELAAEITPKNILMIGPTGVGKTEIARRLAKLANAPFVKVEATKFTQVGYVGRDAESIVRDLMDAAVGMTHDERMGEVREQAAKRAEERLIEILAKQVVYDVELPAEEARKRAAAKTRRAAAAAAPSASNPGAPSAAPATRKTPVTVRSLIKQASKAVAEQLARKELEDKMVEIELDPDDGFIGGFELMGSIASDDFGDSFQDFLSALPGPRRRKKRVSVKEARRLLTQEEAGKLIDTDELIEQATARVEQSGVVFLDEIDKIVGSKLDLGPDVAGEGVQRDLLPIVEGSTVMTRFGAVKTDHILWIAAGAFHAAKPSDLIPELQGRLPLRVELEPLTEADYRRILQQPENALTKQYEALLGVDQVTLAFTDDGIAEIARCAQRMNERVENIGARRLHTVMEKVLEDVSYRGPELAGQTVTVDAAFVRERLAKLLDDEDLSRYIL